LRMNVGAIPYPAQFALNETVPTRAEPTPAAAPTPGPLRVMCTVHRAPCTMLFLQEVSLLEYLRFQAAPSAAPLPCNSHTVPTRPKLERKPGAIASAAVVATGAGHVQLAALTRGHCLATCAAFMGAWLYGKPLCLAQHAKAVVRWRCKHAKAVVTACAPQPSLQRCPVAAAPLRRSNRIRRSDRP
jgi:hypothetical protein